MISATEVVVDLNFAKTQMKNVKITTEIALVIIFLGISIVRIIGCGGRETIEAQKYVELGDKLYEQGYFSDASVMYWNAIKSEHSQPKNLISAHLKLATIYFHLNHWNSDAKVLLRSILEIDPNNSQAHLLLGVILKDEGSQKEAAKEYLQALEFAPKDAKAHYRLGVLYHGEQLYDDAINEYKLAIENDPKFVPARFEIAPFGLQARLMLARLYVTKQRHDEAIAYLEQTVAAAPDYREAKEELIRLLDLKAQALARGGNVRDYTGSLKIYERIIQIDPKQSEAWVKMGEIYAHWLVKPKKALEAFRKAYELDPTDSEVLLYLKELQLSVDSNSMNSIPE